MGKAKSRGKGKKKKGGGKKAASRTISIIIDRTNVRNNPLGNDMVLDIDPNETTFGEIKVRIRNEWGYPTDRQRLLFAGRQLQDDETIANCNMNIGNLSRVHLYLADLNLDRLTLLPGNITVISKSGMSISLDVQPTNTIHDVKLMVQNKWKSNPSIHHLVIDGKDLEDDKTLEECGIRDNGSTLHLVPKPPQQTHRYITIQMIVKDKGYGTNNNITSSAGMLQFDVYIGSTTTIHFIKTKIREKLGVPLSHQRLIFRQHILNEDDTVAVYGIKFSDKIQLVTQTMIETSSSLALGVEGLSKYQFAKIFASVNDQPFKLITHKTPILSFNEQELFIIGNVDAKISKFNLTNLIAINQKIDRVDFGEDFGRTRLLVLSAKDEKGSSVLLNYVPCLTGEDTLQVERFIAGLRTAHRKAYHRKVILNLVWRVVALQRRRSIRSSCVTIQKRIRGMIVRAVYLGTLQPWLDNVHHFYSVWKKTIEQEPCEVQPLSGWALVREGLDLKRMDMLDEDGNLAETNDKLNQALSSALSEDDEEMETTKDDDRMVEDSFGALKVDDEYSYSECDDNDTFSIDWSQFQVTSHVVKFMKQGDSKYRDIFVKRIRQLAKGERSHKLQKPLKGCDSIIYESYLENKGGGFRILWTEEGDRIVVWFIAKHKSVSRLAKLIDDAKSRTARQQMPQSLVDELNDESQCGQTSVKREVLLDALGNVPLKLYDVNFDNIEDISSSSWTPQMSLTDEERKVVEAKGTVLLLGRSGTGKTICICNRIEYDRQRLGHKPKFSQLFVSRSSRLCRYVEKAVGSTPQSNFHTFDNLLRELDAALSKEEEGSGTTNFSQRQRVGIAQFKQFYDQCYPQHEADALIAWKAIRTFLKGSIEAYQTPTGTLSREYFVSNKLGKNRCKVPIHLRDCIYDICIQYQAWLQDQKLWDDCDRIRFLLNKMEEAKQTNSVACDNVKWNKIYVDEVQDYTQIEILLFFYISGGPGALFLAGDPAQSVVEGTDFRFEEVRSVGNYVAGNRRHLIPEKPKIVNINFRSHAGILNCAGGFLDLLFDYFPGSAKQLKKDYGLFKGARPGVFHKVEVQQLAALLQGSLQGCVILTHDESASHWRDVLNHPLVYGIREAKGLEFKSVIILNFFNEIPSSLQKAWRNLLLNREGSDFEQKYPLIETHLKLIYTATTRCIEQLFFAETSPSTAGDAAVRWLTTSQAAVSGDTTTTMKDSIATHNNVSDLESMIMTNDEFCIAGIDNAELATSSDIELDEASTFLKRAIYCFEKAQSSELIAKANAHLLSIQFRSKHSLDVKSYSADKLEILEREVAQLVQSLLEESLLSECMNLLNIITPHLATYTQDKLEDKIISKIQSAA